MALLIFSANNTDSCESGRNGLSHIKSAVLAFQLLNYSKSIITLKIESSDYEHGSLVYKIRKEVNIESYSTP